MPVNKSMMAAMVKEYGKKKAKAVYYAVEAKQKAQAKSKTKSSPKKSK